jgi:hypothetical protein
MVHLAPQCRVWPNVNPHLAEYQPSLPSLSRFGDDDVNEGVRSDTGGAVAIKMDKFFICNILQL